MPELQRLSTFFDILIRIERSHFELVGESSKCVDEMCTQVGVDILWYKLGLPLPVDGPVSIIADNPLSWGRWV